ncbi:MAG: DUF4250 domain-containing protein [Bacteroidales bacterium]|nr:DUF4250 domain-containing protein [Bacteroidales bacterium]MBD5252664.1 DUF4250 domain-containing protein [Barnesiella sp.]MBD5344370.1 DUF4250 domain-containing protein [Bacteroides sp.]
MLLPSDPAILLSFLNMKLRDDYDTVEQLCDDLDIDADDFEAALDKAGIEYFHEGKRFVFKS